MAELRLGDVIDDWCVKCRRLTNHSIVSIVDGSVAKVRCRTCYHDHDYRHEEPPPSRKDLKKAALFDEVLSSIHPEGASGGEESTPAADDAPVTQTEESNAAAADAEPPAPAGRRKGSRKARSNA